MHSKIPWNFEVDVKKFATNINYRINFYFRQYIIWHPTNEHTVQWFGCIFQILENNCFNFCMFEYVLKNTSWHSKSRILQRPPLTSERLLMRVKLSMWITLCRIRTQGYIPVQWSETKCIGEKEKGDWIRGKGDWESLTSKARASNSFVERLNYISNYGP